MSNLIKYPFVQLQGKEKVMINSENREDGFSSLTKQAEKVEENEKIALEFETDEPGFSEEPDTRRVEEVLEEERAKAGEQAEKILDNARMQAEMLLESSKSEAELIEKKAREDGYREGYAAGEIEARQKYDELQEELNITIQRHEEEYRQMVNKIEPKYGELLISLLQKITGVLLEEHEDIILHLIKNSIYNLEKSHHYTIRMSTEDAPIVDIHRSQIREILGEECTVEFLEEKNLKHNECIIETDSQMVDCGFKTQLDSLIEAIKMLAM